jgi:WD repeat-containing protein 48
MAVGSSGSRLARSPDERVTYLLRTPEKRPRSGVNALALGAHDVFAAGRDGVVRAWAVGSGDHAAGSRASFDEHVDWCNDVLLVRGGERLLSASSDTTIKVWNAADPSASLRTLTEHTDYVKALADLADGVSIASASLDGRVLVWDLATGSVRHECECAAAEPSRAASVYCLDSASSTGGLLVAGSTDRLVSVFDSRSGESIVRLRGHTDAVRCLSVKHDGILLLSGSSDSTVRLWDLRQQRCVRTFDSHPADSVWALDTPRSFDTFVSGGRDGTVWHTAIDGDSATLVVAVADPVPRSNMVLDVAIDIVDQRTVWVSSTGSTVRQWRLPSPNGTNGGDTTSDVRVLRSGAERARVSNNVVDMDLDNLPPGELTAMRHTFGGTRGPIAELRGLPAIVKYKIMNNRRHVMTCDTADEVSLWDITSGTLIRSLGTIPDDNDLDAFAETHDEIVAVPSWFQVDIRLGSLGIRLDRASVANAEVYACDAGLEMENEDIKVNIGEHVVRGLFATWKARLQCTILAAEAAAAETNFGAAALPPLPAASGGGAETSGGPAGGSSTRPSSVSAPAKEPLLPYTFPADTPVIVTEESAVPILQRHAGSFEGDMDTRFLPAWVVDLVRDGRSQAREGPVKIGFTIYPAEGAGLPELGMVSLNAPRVLRVRKVAAYVAKELNLLVDEDNALQRQVEASELDILCHGVVLPPTMNLATVRQFKWRSPDDLQLHFRLTEPQ